MLKEVLIIFSFLQLAQLQSIPASVRDIDASSDCVNGREFKSILTTKMGALKNDLKDGQNATLFTIKRYIQEERAGDCNCKEDLQQMRGDIERILDVLEVLKKMTKQVVNCGPLEYTPTHGHMSLSSTVFASVATYTCNTGYNLNGDGTRTCQANGTWSGVEPTCEIVNCGSLSHPANGQVSFSASTTYNSVATYSCNNCYELNGGSTRRCEANGQWSGSQPTCSGGGYAPFYRYWNGRDHFYTTSINEIGTATHGQAGDHGYTSEGTQCIIRSCQVSGSIPLYRYWNGHDHFYTTNADEIGVTTPGAGGNHGYTSEGTAGYCFPSQVQNTIPLYRYYRSASGDHFYTTSANEIGTTTPGQTGNHGYRSEGTQCYVHPN